MFQSELFAAQLIFLRKPSKVTVSEMFAIVFQDLTLKRVLNLQKLNNYPTERSKKTQKYFMFTKGVNYEGYEAQNFEKFIITAFEDHENLQAKTITNGMLRKYGLPSGYITDEIMGPLKRQGLMSTVPILGAFGMKKPTPKGKDIINELNNYLSEKEQELTECVDQDREKFISILQEMKTLVFFIKKENTTLYASIIENVKWVNQNKPLGFENDLSEFTEAINIDTSYLEAH